MAEILSQSEIDELLKAFSQGEIKDLEKVKVEEKKTKKIRSYDFRRPNKFSKEQLRTLQMIFENFSRSLTSFLSGYLRTIVNVAVVSVDQLTYYEFSNSLNNPVFIAIIDASPLEGPFLLELNNNTTYAILDRLLGGMGKGEFLDRDYTEIEINLLTKIVKQILPLLEDPWSNIIDLTPSLMRVETNSQFAQIISPNETVALCTLSIKINETEGMMNFCMPHLTLEPIVPKLTTKFWFSSMKKEEKVNPELIKEKIDKTYIPLTVQLGSATVTVGDLLKFEVGDVIMLDKRYNEPVEVIIDKKVKFKGIPGIKSKRYSVKITEVIYKGDEESE
ncbi:MAG: Flagellar motor switch protein [Caldanaerobacter subterraneus]|uniref:Flagellar motor switch protein FliM n=1 Tax=Caldanaerobacter subterraneus TaxID=911092 RepID=A0A101E6S8_9THEO|nr:MULTISPECIES: flagellar motor switch protein FliM [Caldanaerobacter]KUK09869.1 MAG: Flagellar motor switch protein [Caldanaerobacter subterraneus]MDI3518106.1 flagellar motor switch protein FliM [Caldanaerobacter sp.]TCO67788.1 flagellar motor switch protein FliM [Caldanaerobacter subterraneus]HBT49412.1 flagellar motor switch protein FliM [Caldanaerobacter subterraneus]